MPDAPDPSTLANEKELMEMMLADPKISPRAKAYFEKNLALPLPIEIRHCFPQIRRFRNEPRQRAWLRSQPLDDNPMLHSCVVAYASDHMLLGTSLYSRGTLYSKTEMMASLDHSMWFHSDFKADEWLLYDMESRKAHGARAICFGRIYTTDGRLVASVAQEGLVRVSTVIPKSSL
eukprot:TRINITY_DN2668_c0_g1_i1.p1 TRINITY_DN2668_c0_g1~~TRINITY_DN2668_c0_g1_i1.p1  ORF type:complete len:176 (-),score=27.71 TRINITY_DN2668_c0_g1_i1:75-602(-)